MKKTELEIEKAIGEIKNRKWFDAEEYLNLVASLETAKYL